MLEMRPGCEHCDKDLPPEKGGAMICSFECTFCDKCAAEVFRGVCPNCEGDLFERPTRAKALLAKYPASTARVFKPKDQSKE